MPGANKRPLPKTKFANVEVDGFGPAHLDDVSLWNGVNRFNHKQHTMNQDEYQFCLGYLRYLFPLLQYHSDKLDNSKIAELIVEHSDKSAGDPFIEFGCPVKADALAAYGVDGLLEIYDNNFTVISATLKDEVRDLSKDARFFRPQCCASYAKGSQLFYNQNEYMMSQPLQSHVFVKFQTPGPDLITLFESLNGDKYDADGRSWDANFPLVAASIICDFRSGANYDEVHEYYSRIYNGLTCVDGYLFHLRGNASGHVNTSVDNCLLHCILFALHSYRNNIFSYQKLEDLVSYWCCGDDLVWSSHSSIFAPAELEKTYNSMGVFLEFSSMRPMDLFDLSFVGSTPVKYHYLGRELLLYKGRVGKLLAKFKIHRRKMTPIEHLQKMCSIAALLLADEKLFDSLYTIIMDFVHKGIASNFFAPSDPTMLGCIGYIQRHNLVMQYTNWERGSHFSSFPPSDF